MTSSILTPNEGGREPEGSGSRPSDQARSGLGGSRVDPSRIMREALERIRDMEERPFTGWPTDWHEQIAACEECRAYANHPIQQGICNTHRQPIYAQDKHDRHERQAMGWRMATIAREALSAIATEARRALPKDHPNDHRQTRGIHNG